MTTFKKASRQQQRVKIGIAGPSGAGKTMGALALAHQLASSPDKVAVLDTENGSASLYADRYAFDVIEVRPPYLSQKFLDGIQAAVEGGYEVLVIDSISHQWDGDGGILQRKEETDARGGNHFSNWAPFTKEHNAFRAALLNAPIHLICTMRSKQAYQMEENGKKSTPKKLGLQPIQREGMEYEFTLTFDVQMDHKASASKDRTTIFADKLTDLTDPKTGKALLAWLDAAEPVAMVTNEQRDALVGIMGADYWTQAERDKAMARLVGATAEKAAEIIARADAEASRRRQERKAALVATTG